MASDPFSYQRFRTREVMVGDVGVGGDNPIRIQSMTTPATTDVKATVAQIERLRDAGCEIVRVTVPSRADADALPLIRRELRARAIDVPLVADIHFTPAAALMAVEHVEKVRVNPGNYADKKRFDVREYSDAEYAAELDRIRDRFVPLVSRAKELGRSMRIGTNHGSLSDRIMNRYGDSALGMVESALEFVRIARAEGYHDLILSMKSSNPLVAIEAYRLLVERMQAEAMDYPLHLGVTEAGDGEDARIKSAIGIGALLDEGIGDTIRVSLTEDPVAEIPVAYALARPYNERLENAGSASILPELATRPDGPVRRPLGERRTSRPVRLGKLPFGDGGPVRAEVRARTRAARTQDLLAELVQLGGPEVPVERRPELIVVEVTSAEDAQVLGLIAEQLAAEDFDVRLGARLTPEMVAGGTIAPLLDVVVRLEGLPPTMLEEQAWEASVLALAETAELAGVPLLFAATLHDVPDFIARSLPDPQLEGPIEVAVRATAIARAAGAEVIAGVWTTAGAGPTAAARLLTARLGAAGLDVPQLGLDLGGPGLGGSSRDPLLAPSVHLGGLLADGLVDGVRIESEHGSERDLRFTWDLLQGARQRVVKTEFIACPSCGRTLFDLEETTQRIRARTGHLKGLKIAIMGCIVNGPGEMADADFGYVGWGPGKVALFAGKEMVAKDIPFAVADERLIELIRAHGKWIDPPSA